MKLKYDVDPLHRDIVDSALTRGSDLDVTVEMTFGELFLFHTLLQDYGPGLAGDDRYIPLLTRSYARLERAEP